MTITAETHTKAAPAADKAIADAHAALASARRFAADLPVNPALVDLGRELKVAENEWAAQGDRTDAVKAEREGREISDEDEAIWEAASSRHMDALERVLEYQPRSTAELGYKARLIGGGSVDTRFRAEEDMDKVYLRDALALEGAEPTDPEWQRLVEGYEASRKAWLANGEEDPVSREREVRLTRAWEDAETELMAYAAPSLAALAYKLRVWLRPEVEEEKSDCIDDPRFISAALRLGYVGERQLLGIYLDLLRLAGRNPAVAYAKPFNAEAVLAAIDVANHRLEIVDDDCTVRVLPVLTSSMGGKANEAVQSLVDGLTQAELRVLRTLIEVRGEAQPRPHLMAAE